MSHIIWFCLDTQNEYNNKPIGSRDYFFPKHATEQRILKNRKKEIFVEWFKSAY